MIPRRPSNAQPGRTVSLDPEPHSKKTKDCKVDWKEAGSGFQTERVRIVTSTSVTTNPLDSISEFPQLPGKATVLPVTTPIWPVSAGLHERRGEKYAEPVLEPEADMQPDQSLDSKSCPFVQKREGRKSYAQALVSKPVIEKKMSPGGDKVVTATSPPLNEKEIVSPEETDKGDSKALTTQQQQKELFSSVLQSQPPASARRPLEPALKLSKQTVRRHKVVIRTRREVENMIYTEHPEALDAAKLLYLSDENDQKNLAVYCFCLKKCGYGEDAFVLMEARRKICGDQHISNRLLLEYVGSLNAKGESKAALVLINEVLSKLSHDKQDYFRFIQLKADSLKELGDVKAAITLINDTMEDSNSISCCSSGQRHTLLRSICFCLKKVLSVHVLTSAERAEYTRLLRWYRKSLDKKKQNESIDVAIESIGDFSRFVENIREFEEAYLRVERQWKEHIFKSDLERKYYYIRMIKHKAVYLWHKGKHDDAMRLAQNEIPGAIKLLEDLKQKNPLILGKAFNAVEVLVTDHCARMAKFPEIKRREAMQMLRLFLDKKDQILPDYILAAHRYTRLRVLFLKLANPDDYLGLLKRLNPNDLDVKIEKIRVDMEIQLFHGCIFSDMLGKVKALRKDHPTSISVKTLEGELLYNLACKAITAGSSDAEHVIKECTDVLNQLIAVAQSHQAYSLRGHLAGIVGEGEVSRWCHEKAKTVSTLKTRRIDEFTEVHAAWEARKEETALCFKEMSLNIPNTDPDGYSEYMAERGNPPTLQDYISSKEALS